MDRNKLKFLVDTGMAISFLAVALTGLFKWPTLSIKFLWIYRVISFRFMSRIHDWSGVILALLVLIHLILNWAWIKCMFLGLFKKQEKCDIQNGKRK